MWMEDYCETSFINKIDLEMIYLITKIDYEFLNYRILLH